MEFREIVPLIKATIEKAEEVANKQYTKIFVSHDWGCFLTYLFDSVYPNYIRLIYAFDVSFSNKPIVIKALSEKPYVKYLAEAFEKGGEEGDKMSRKMMDLLLKDPEFEGITEDDIKRFDHSWNYMYYYLVKYSEYYSTFLKKYQPSCPIFYAYGKNKEKMFHDERALETLRKT
eukprot:CAMPEP_0170525052 /NCGR_PEP_ID=MMETSP0209-20121228/10518_1 /TAXON_ID=665100 ORGANISM="Litonotus pictus, Strain P1" /NCGR_SAMPLE_ID=MMETSP0209 /ASSEMBLY_ACC=CAM_ASM_000301 /LENGTH=173 /DNA_ID=CAMNT_0010814093 /DNA_START=211 /DNA_END=728 /DNA_ORIENTATION=+